MSKQLILITAPFNCGYCETAKKELPSICESKGYEFVEVEDDPKDALGADNYPTVMFRINEEIVDTIIGYNKENLLSTIKKH
jgi:hypothetical protein